MHLSSRSIHQSHLITADPSAPTATLLNQWPFRSHKEVGKGYGTWLLRVLKAAYGSSELPYGDSSRSIFSALKFHKGLGGDYIRRSFRWICFSVSSCKSSAGPWLMWCDRVLQAGVLLAAHQAHYIVRSQRSLGLCGVVSGRGTGHTWRVLQSNLERGRETALHDPVINPIFTFLEGVRVAGTGSSLKRRCADMSINRRSVCSQHYYDIVI